MPTSAQTRARGTAKKAEAAPPPNPEEELSQLSEAFPRWKLKLTPGGTFYAIRKVHLIETDERIDWGFRSGIYEGTSANLETAIKAQEQLHETHNVPL